MSTSKKLAKPDNLPSQFESLTSMDPAAFVQAMKTNLGGGGFNLMDLERIKVPSGETLAFVREDLSGEQNLIQQLNGVIVLQRNPRARWINPLSDGGAGSPPDCQSLDGAYGTGDPGGLCDSCPYAMFGSARDGSGRGQACKQMKQMVTMLPEEALPVVVVAPPTSLGSMRKYLLRLTSKGREFYRVVTGFKLERGQNQDGIKYGKLAPVYVRDLDEQEAGAAGAFMAAFDAMFQGAPLEGSDFAHED